MDGKATLRLRRPLTNNIQNLYHESYDLLHCEYSLSKQVNKQGKVNGNIRAGNIVVALPILPDDNIMTWVFDVSRKYNGEISINDAYEESLEKIYFEEARPIGFRLHYEPGDTTNVILLLTINAQHLIIGESEYTNNRR
ncbi:type VI secretion system tube protein TssD [Prevotella sp. 10(H)]|uniref:type VI secretion system tube protein TssD n=1 Tax=Prevotella sp. 10(H) TaxID=1158294 RepID=UPI0004A75468|nr:type VI secretion system tube protein TssD [Prevotella sp. 10(H)]